MRDTGLSQTEILANPEPLQDFPKSKIIEYEEVPVLEEATNIEDRPQIVDNLVNEEEK